ncbi:hypothetical protein B879_02041 [Cecembia lonarensis LW9]|uniref:Uncharacterized protein n=1 Tax=Cecembia lonarensis (strain CCUG 58316 / KCTC 22772 / LW9) TaxID=1225176 RepID=K1L3H9_CECL9|nr:hypothetical protein B879_02041 [Cecembia lonarensis LW9]
MEALRYGYMKFDSDNCPNKKEAVPIYETASFDSRKYLLRRNYF